MSRTITGYIVTNSEASAHTKFILHFTDERITEENRKVIPYVHDSEAEATAELEAMLTCGPGNPHEFEFAQTCSVWRITWVCEQLVHTRRPDAG